MARDRAIPIIVELEVNVIKSLITILFALSFFITACTSKTEAPKANVVSAASPQASSPISSSSPAAPANSTYTGLDEKTCKKTEPNPNSKGVIYQAECPGAGGYKVIHSASDHSAELTLVDPAGKSTDLGLRDAVNSAAGFIVGDKMEWRLGDKGVPNAFIVRANKFIDPVDLNKQESNLLVGKISANGSCVTDVVGPSTPDQNARARELADTAKDRPCVPKLK